MNRLSNDAHYAPKDRNYWHKVSWGLYVMLKIVGFSDSILAEMASESIVRFNVDPDKTDPKMDEFRLQIYYGLIKITSKR